MKSKYIQVFKIKFFMQHARQFNIQPHYIILLLEEVGGWRWLVAMTWNICDSSATHFKLNSEQYHQATKPPSQQATIICIFAYEKYETCEKELSFKLNYFFAMITKNYAKFLIIRGRFEMNGGIWGSTSMLLLLLLGTGDGVCEGA